MFKSRVYYFIKSVHSLAYKVLTYKKCVNWTWETYPAFHKRRRTDRLCYQFSNIPSRSNNFKDLLVSEVKLLVIIRTHLVAERYSYETVAKLQFLCEKKKWRNTEYFNNWVSRSERKKTIKYSMNQITFELELHLMSYLTRLMLLIYFLLWFATVKCIHYTMLLLRYIYALLNVNTRQITI